MPKKKKVKEIKPWKWSRTFDMEWIADNVFTIEFGYESLREEDDRSAVRRLRTIQETRIQKLGRQITKHLLKQPNSVALLSKLAERLDAARRMYGYIDTNLARSADESWNWSEVITAIAHLVSYVRGFEDTLGENGIREDR